MDLSLPIDSVKGVGPKTAGLLAAAGLQTLRDLLYFLPRTYENFQGAGDIAGLRPGKVVVKARVEGVRTTRRRRNLAITEAVLRDRSGAVRAVWFNQPYRDRQFVEGKEYYFSGDFGLSAGRYQITNPAVAMVAEYDAAADKYQPVYPARGELTSKKICAIFAKLKAGFADIPEFLPSCPGRAEALFAVHFPESEADVRRGRDYLAQEELFGLILASALNRETNARLRAVAVAQNLPILKKAVASLPFKLTDAQRRAVWEIVQDMEKPVPMNRLLQGDVGSGKTMVAGLSALVAASAGYQTALLAPTEILAAQHAETLHKLLGPLGVRVALLTGSTKKKPELKRRIEAGEVDLVVGTHALLTDDMRFHALALTIIDEQHRFGVAQRQKLISKASLAAAPHSLNSGKLSLAREASLDYEVQQRVRPPLMPHLLSMTATPIPRSLQLTIFGDLAVSVLNELPKGRQPITTKIVSPNSTGPMWGAVREEIARGHQCFYICKMIEESKMAGLADVKRETQKLRAQLPGCRVEFLHGKMKTAEKDAIMGEFVAGRIQILVSTTVVEVGVDVPNATVIVIADADRYGLAQLHQLRGRVGRGSAAAYCYLINSSSERPTRRLREIEGSTDGFYLAEVDLKLRGPGAIYGTLQHGVLDLRIATISDTAAIARAQKSVRAFLQTGPNLLEYRELSEVVQRYQKLTTLN